MRITIDTEKDSPEMVRRAIELLQLTLGDGAVNSFLGNTRSAFHQSQNVSAFDQQGNSCPTNQEQKPRRLKPKDILRQQAMQQSQSQQDMNPFSMFGDEESSSSQPQQQASSSTDDMFSLFNEPEVKETQSTSSQQQAELSQGSDLIDMFSHELPSSAPRQIEEESNILVDDIARPKKKQEPEFYDLEQY